MAARHLYHLLMHIGQLLEEETRAKLQKKGLCHGQGRVLSALYRSGEMTQADLARGLGIKPATVTNMLRRMESRRLVERRTDTITNRAVIVSLTEAGREAARTVWSAWDSIGEQLGEAVPEGDMVPTLSTLEQIRDTLGGSGPKFVGCPASEEPRDG